MQDSRSPNTCGSPGELALGSTGVLPSLAPINTVHDRLRQLERRDWWLWTVAAVVVIALCALLWSFSLPPLEHADQELQRQLDIRVKGLCVIILLFTGFIAYQQLLIRRLRRSLQAEIGVVSEMHGRSEAAQNLTILDPLTGLFNRRFALDFLAREITRCEKDHMSLTVILINLDNFSRVNQQYGHAAGDAVLQRFAHHVKKSIRSADVPVRMGADEFLIILPECTAIAAKGPLGRLHSCEVDLDGTVNKIRFSLGIAQHKPGELPGELLRRADEDLYHQKHDRQVTPEA